MKLGLGPEEKTLRFVSRTCWSGRWSDPTCFARFGEFAATKGLRESTG